MFIANSTVRSVPLLSNFEQPCVIDQDAMQEFSK